MFGTFYINHIDILRLDESYNMEKKIENIIKEISRLMENKYPYFQGIYLFGSRLDDKASKNSDVDLAIVFDKKIDRTFKSEILDLIYEFDLKYNLFFDAKIFSKEEISNPITPFRTVIKEKGIFYGVR